MDIKSFSDLYSSSITPKDSLVSWNESFNTIGQAIAKSSSNLGLLDMSNMSSIVAATNQFKFPDYASIYASALNNVNVVNNAFGNIGKAFSESIYNINYNNEYSFIKDIAAYQIPIFKGFNKIDAYDFSAVINAFYKDAYAYDNAYAAYNELSESKSLAFASFVPSVASAQNSGLFGRKIIDQNDLPNKLNDNDQSGIEDFVNSLEEGTQSKIAFGRHLKRNAFNYIGIVFAVYAFIQSGVDNKKMEDRINQRILDSENRIVSSFQSEIGILRLSDKKYVINRCVNIRKKPNSRADITCSLYPNTLVDIIDERNEWVLITTFDFINGKSIDGWMDKKYLSNGKILNK